MNQQLISDLVLAVKSRYMGRYRALVVDTNDSTERGRLQVQVPAVLDELTVWAMPSSPYAGDQVGLYTMPPAGSGVWVEFEGGDPSYPVWAGAFWADGQLPDDSTEGVKVLKTNSLTVRLDDDEKEILVNADDNAEVIISDRVSQTVGGVSQLVDSNGVVSDSGGTGKIEVTSSGVNVDNGALEVT